MWPESLTWLDYAVSICMILVLISLVTINWQNILHSGGHLGFVDRFILPHLESGHEEDCWIQALACGIFVLGSGATYWLTDGVETVWKQVAIFLIILIPAFFSLMSLLAVVFFRIEVRFDEKGSR